MTSGKGLHMLASSSPFAPIIYITIISNTIIINTIIIIVIIINIITAITNVIINIIIDSGGGAPGCLPQVRRARGDRGNGK